MVDKRTYAAEPIPEEQLRRLCDCVARHGHTLDVDSSPGGVARIMEWNAASVVDNLQIEDERREIQSWYRTGPTPEMGDGLWNGPFCQPAWEVKLAFAAPGLMTWPGVRQWAEAKFIRSQRAPHVGFLRGPFRTAPELFAAGRALMDLWLVMADLDVYMHPMGSMLTNPIYAERVARHVKQEDVWLVVRLGRSAEPPRAPRLAAKDYVIP